MTRRLPLTTMDVSLLAQTMPGRPMTTHHVLELTGSLTRQAWLRASEHLVEHTPVLRSVIRETARSVERVALPFDQSSAHRAIVFADSTDLNASGWLDRPFDLGSEAPFRVRVCPSSVVFTLHHSVTDGRGALTLFDWFLHSALAAECGASLPASPFDAEPREEPALGFSLTSRVAMRAASSLGRFFQDRACLLERPGAEVERFETLVTDLSPQLWKALREVAASLGCTRNHLLWSAALRAAADMPKAPTDDASLALRFVGGVDLRELFGAQRQLGNWVGTLEADFTLDQIRGQGFEAKVKATLLAAKAPVEALVTPALMKLCMKALSFKQYRSLYDETDQRARPFMYSLLLSHIRPHGEMCWPAELKPQRLWCVSTLPRKPGLGLTVTTVKDHVTIAACWPVPLSTERSVRRFIEALLAQLQAYVQRHRASVHEAA